jgi:hypothetical protein
MSEPSPRRRSGSIPWRSRSDADVFIEGPPGLPDVAKQKMVADVTRAADEACHVPDVRVWLREYPSELYAQDGVIGAPVRPIATLEAPELGNIETTRSMVVRIDAAFAEAYEGFADTQRHDLHQRLSTRASRVGGPDAERPSRDRRGSETTRRLTAPLKGPPRKTARARRARSDVRQNESSRTQPTDQQRQENQRCPST